MDRSSSTLLAACFPLGSFFLDVGFALLDILPLFLPMLTAADNSLVNIIIYSGWADKHNLAITVEETRGN